VKTFVHFAQFFLEGEMLQLNLFKKNHNFIFKIFFPENVAVYEIMWKNTVEPDMPQMDYGVCALHAG
jgi:hypothetical protein